MEKLIRNLLVVVTLAATIPVVMSFAAGTDARIEAAAKESYVFKTYLSDDAITIKARDGSVLLTGTVANESHKSLAAETVASLPGVKNIDNQLEISGEHATGSSDGWISMQVKSLLMFNRNVSGLKTQVFVNDGIVILKGEAENQAQKDLAAEYAKDVAGVLGVRNEMTIAAVPEKIERTKGEKIDDASITAQVKVALLTHRSTRAIKTGVNTENGVVTLSGKVTSGAAKDMVTKVATDVHGVTRVINTMVVAE